MSEKKIHQITLPKSVANDLKDGWIYELSWDYETNEFNLCASQHYPIKEQRENDKSFKELIKRNRSNGALPQTPKFKKK